jgi:hypothetical protein
MKRIPSLGFLAPLLAAAILSGCGAPGGWDQGRYPNRYPDRNPDGAYGRDGDRVVDLQGTVASVNPRERLIYVDREGADDRYNPRNDDRYDQGDAVALSYDDSTVVRYQGRTFRPGDLERGDRIQASLERNGDYLLAQQINVIYDVSSGPGNPGTPGNGGYDRGGDDNGNGGYDNGNGGYSTDLRGTVRAVDTRNRTLEIDRSRSDNRDNFNSDPGGYGGGSNGGYGTVLVRYDAGTTVRFQGQDYSPENLERGDVVRIQARDDNGRLTAERIDVLGENGRTGR